LTINPFYRKQAGQVFDAATEKFSDPPVRTRLVALMGSDDQCRQQQGGRHRLH